MVGDEDRSGRQRPGERAAGGARASSGAGEAGGFCTEACEVGRFCSITVTSCRAEGVCRALRTKAEGGVERETRGAGDPSIR